MRPPTQQDKPSFSIVMTCYKFEEYIEEAIMSCFAQDYDGEMELIIVDDCSPDASVEVIRRVLAERGKGWQVKFVAKDKNEGTARATDVGWALASKDWIIIADGDDVLKPNRCSLAASLIMEYRQQGKELMAISFAREWIDAQGTCYDISSYTGFTNDIGILPHRLLLEKPEEKIRNYTQGPHTVTCAGCVLAMNRKLYTQWGAICQGEGDHRRVYQDRVLWTRALLSGPVLGVNDIAIQYRCHGRNQDARKMDWSYNGYIQNELYYSKAHQAYRDMARLQMESIERATLHPELTDCPPAVLHELRTHLKNMYKLHCLMADWWEIPWVSRLKRYRHNRSGSVLRLLPLHVFAFLRYINFQILKRK